MKAQTIEKITEWFKAIEEELEGGGSSKVSDSAALELVEIWAEEEGYVYEETSTGLYEGFWEATITKEVPA